MSYPPPPTTSDKLEEIHLNRMLVNILLLLLAIGWIVFG